MYCNKDSELGLQSRCIDMTLDYLVGGKVFFEQVVHLEWLIQHARREEKRKYKRNKIA